MKRLPIGARHGGTTREVLPTSLTIRNATIGNSIDWAWGYENFRVIGPAWRDFPTDVVFDVSAKTSAPVSEAEIKRMFQSLLRERFGLQFHIEKRDMPVYAMVVDRGGPKFHESQTAGEVSVKYGAGLTTHFERISMARFAMFMDPPYTSRHVIDETGLAGIYDFTVKLEPFIIDPQTGKAILDSRGAIDMEVGYIQALPKQLGLRLERKTAPLEVMVIDRVEKEPTGN